MAYRYEVYVYDSEIRLEYPITIVKEDIKDFCRWINAYALKWNLEVVDAYLVDYLGNKIDRLHFLPIEYATQYFISSYEDRLLKHVKRGG